MIEMTKEDGKRSAIEAVFQVNDGRVRGRFIDAGVAHGLLPSDMLLIWEQKVPLNNLLPATYEKVCMCVEEAYPDFERELGPEMTLEECLDAFLSSGQNVGSKQAFRIMIRKMNRYCIDHGVQDLFHADRTCVVAMMESDELSLWNRATVRSVLSRVRKFLHWCSWMSPSRTGCSAATVDQWAIKVPELSLVRGIRRCLYDSPHGLIESLSRAVGETQIHSGGSLIPIVGGLAWMGFTNEEMLTILPDEVDLDRGVIRDQPIPDAFLPIFRAYDKREESVRRLGQSEMITWKEDSGRFLRRFVYQSPPEFRAAQIPQVFRYVDITLTEIRASSIFWRLYETEKEHALLPDEFACAFHIDTASTSLASELRESMDEYADWKSAFYPEEIKTPE